MLFNGECLQVLALVCLLLHLKGHASSKAQPREALGVQHGWAEHTAPDGNNGILLCIMLIELRNES